MWKKRLFAFSLIIALSVSFLTLQTNPGPIASAQDVKVKQDGFIAGCSETVIDALNECIQKRFSKFDMRLGLTRIVTIKLPFDHFVAETQSEREAISELEKGGWQVAFYLVGRRILGTKLDTLPGMHISVHDNRVINGPVAITPSTIFDKRDHGTGQILATSSVGSNWRKTLEQLDLPELTEIWDDARKAMLEFEKRDQYDFSFRKWNIAARPIRAKEACLKCHTDESPLAPPKVGDALGVAMYAYAHKQKDASTLNR
ncbi:MAG TPA: hypothetical protein VJZ77_04210 [Blastocatellia bacterium]|nr:hypothetical protein [Blastocatellia bacterium]